LPCPALPYIALPCLALPCLALPCLAFESYLQLALHTVRLGFDVSSLGIMHEHDCA